MFEVLFFISANTRYTCCRGSWRREGIAEAITFWVAKQKRKRGREVGNKPEIRTMTSLKVQYSCIYKATLQSTHTQTNMGNTELHKLPRRHKTQRGRDKEQHRKCHDFFLKPRELHITDLMSVCGSLNKPQKTDLEGKHLLLSSHAIKQI